MIRASGEQHSETQKHERRPQNAFRLSFITERTELPIPAASQILARLRSGPAWDGASIAPADAQFPLLRVEWHESHGFVVQANKRMEPARSGRESVRSFVTFRRHDATNHRSK